MKINSFFAIFIGLGIMGSLVEDENPAPSQPLQRQSHEALKLTKHQNASTFPEFSDIESYNTITERADRAISEVVREAELSLGRQCKDLDVAVHHVTLEELNNMRRAGQFGSEIKKMSVIYGITIPNSRLRKADIYVASNMSDSEKEITLAHEYAHIVWLEHCLSTKTSMHHETFAYDVEREYKSL